MLSPAWSEGIARYVESCRTPDGGYFFARIPPGSPHDTFYAVATLRLLGRKPADPEAVCSFFQALLARDALVTPAAIDYAVSTLVILNKLSPPWKELARKLSQQQDPHGGFWVPQQLWVEATSRLENTFHAARALTLTSVEFDREACARLVGKELEEALNTNDLSGLATVFYGTAILKLIGKESLLPRKDVLLFLQEVEPLALSYLEYCYYLTATYSLLPGKPNHPEKLLSFVKKCACRQGGFARSPHPCGLPTLIATYQATFILSFLFNSKTEGTILV